MIKKLVWFIGFSFFIIPEMIYGQCNPTLNDLLNQNFCQHPAHGNRDEFGVISFSSGYKVQAENNPFLTLKSCSTGSCSYYLMAFDTDGGNNTGDLAPYNIPGDQWNRIEVKKGSTSDIFWFYSFLNSDCSGAPDFVVNTDGTEYVKDCTNKTIEDYISTNVPNSWYPPKPKSLYLLSGTSTLKWTYYISGASFKLYRSDSYNGTYSFHKSTSSTSHHVTTSGYYKVFASAHGKSGIASAGPIYVEYPPKGPLPKRTDDDDNSLPVKFALSTNYPNPFNPETTIKFDLAESVFATLKIFNANGQHIKTLFSEHAPAGSYAVNWNGKKENGDIAPSGMYFYKLTAGQFIQTNRMTLLK